MYFFSRVDLELLVEEVDQGKKVPQDSKATMAQRDQLDQKETLEKQVNPVVLVKMVPQGLKDQQEDRDQLVVKAIKAHKVPLARRESKGTEVDLEDPETVETQGDPDQLDHKDLQETLANLVELVKTVSN